MPSGPRSVNAQLLDSSVRHAVHMRRFGTRQTRLLTSFLEDEVLPDLTSRIQSAVRREVQRGRTLESTRRLKNLQKTIKRIIRDGSRAAKAHQQADLIELAYAERGFTERQIQGGIGAGVDINFELPPSARLREVVTKDPMFGETLTNWWGDFDRRMVADVSRTVNLGLLEGKTMPQITRDLVGDVGPYARSRKNVATIARTAVNHTQNTARMRTLAENTDIVSEWQFVATLDLRTSDICISLDGTTWPVGSGPLPPRHPNCRSASTPVLKSFRELGIPLDDIPEGTRASMDGKVPEKLTYQEWLKNRTKAEQNDVLGVAKAARWRKGEDIFPADLDRRPGLSLKDIDARQGKG